MKYLFTTFLFAFVFCCQAQISKKSFLISGNISYNHSRSERSYSTYVDGQSYDVESTFTSNILYFAPKVGYFLSNRWCVGVSLPIFFSKNTSRDSQIAYWDYTNKSRGLGVGPFVRYYIPLKTKLFVITEASYSWDRNRTKSQGYQTDIDGDIIFREDVSKLKSQTFRAGAGLSYLLNKNVGLELLATYRKPVDEDYYDSYNDIMVQLGLQIYLSK